MNRAERTKIMVEGDPNWLKQMAEQIESRYRVEMVKRPEKSLVMTKVRDSVSQQPFYVGEVLITECTVSIAGHYGFGALMGEQFERAYQLAVVDAAWNAGLPETNTWLERFKQEEKEILRRHKQELMRVMRTKVQFDTAGEYDEPKSGASGA